MGFDYDASTREQARIARLIKEQGAGAGVKWHETALAAMGGSEECRAAIEGLIGHEFQAMLDYYHVMSAAIDVMAKGERAATLDMASQRAARPGAINHVADNYLANRLGDLRREQGLTQQELAHQAGIPIVTLQKLENGKNSLLGAQTRTTMKIAAALGLAVEDLIGTETADTTEGE